ncbi:DUF397 domain-containing protein [Amycolatopsis anabasis]|uniref:DUF397 domain-containing protein n=1 Tax=Amycolatopsis anabasis TaxID=1840409 RepID=UPI00131A737A|nr:DUF397 domain-containing protein [Amycolatopsis anabasis]
MPTRERTGLTWHKSSYSDNPNGDCVEVGWRKSTYSINPNGDCVEVTAIADAVAVRDSKDPAGGWLEIEPSAWGVFVSRMKG